jgi:hypothetical protein
VPRRRSRRRKSLLGNAKSKRRRNGRVSLLSFPYPTLQLVSERRISLVLFEQVIPARRRIAVVTSALYRERADLETSFHLLILLISISQGNLCLPSTERREERIESWRGFSKKPTKKKKKNEHVLG